MAKKEYRFKISGVHYAANPEAETKRLPDTEEMHVRTRELLTKIDRERPLVSLFAEPTNLFNPDCIMAFSRGKRIGRVLNVMFEQGRFKGKDGAKLTKKDFFMTMGKAMNVDLSDYDKHLSRSMADSTKLDKHMRVFEEMSQTMMDLWNSR